MGRLEPEDNDWFFKKFPEHPNTEEGNHKWVRDKLSERGTPADIMGIIKVLPQAQIDWIFERTIQYGYFGIEITDDGNR